MEEEKDVFYVVRKGDIIGIYKNLRDCQNQVGSSVCNPSVSVFKGYCLPKEAEQHLVSHGLKNPSYTISASDVKDDLFGNLEPCLYQEPASSLVKSVVLDSLPKRLQVLEPDNTESCKSKRSDQIGIEMERPTFWLDYEMVGSTSFSTHSPNKHFKADNCSQTLPFSSTYKSCILEFDGASKGNPGQSGAGAVLRDEDGSVVYRLREGVGIATNNVAEYRAVILGLKYALKKGYTHINVKGDSKLVCMQIQGLWKIKNQNMADLCQVARNLIEKFLSFDINHVLREYNSEADVQANRAVNLGDGQVEVDSCGK